MEIVAACFNHQPTASERAKAISNQLSAIGPSRVRMPIENLLSIMSVD
jgi:hypothetical protein